MENHTNITHNYRGFRIVKHDTGGRRIGRVVSYRIIDPTTDEVLASSFLLKNAKAVIDFRLDANPEQVAHRDNVAAMLLGDAR